MGPWYVHDGYTTRRVKGTKKTWAVLFTCLTSRAVNMEMLPSLDTTAMKNVLSRFTALRDESNLIRSDRGTNFIAASDCANLKQITEDLGKAKAKWIFNPPHSSHFGGVWERKIGQIKRALDSSLGLLGNRVPSRDELSTLMQEASAIVNSTPLWEISDDPNDPLPLTPSMLLTMKRQAHSVEDFSEHDLNAYGNKFWRRAQCLADKFWRDWRTYYLQDLQKRQKWQTKSENLKSGDLVLLKDKNAPRKQWPMGLVLSVKESDDGLVRSLKVKSYGSENRSKASIFERPISSVVLLIKQ